jgi:hypothetical protein
MLDLLDPSQVDGFAIHAYGNGDTWDAAAEFMKSGDGNGFLGYEEQLGAIHAKFPAAPTLISEFNTILDDISLDLFLFRAIQNVEHGTRDGGHPVLGASWYSWGNDPNTDLKDKPNTRYMFQSLQCTYP